MRFESLTPSYTRTQNLGDFNSLRVGLSSVVSLDDGDQEGVPTIIKGVFSLEKAHVRNQIVSAMGKPADQASLGLPEELMPFLPSSESQNASGAAED